jgi:integrase
VWKTAAERAGLPEWATPHDLRHYFASVLIFSGASVKTVQARLGHGSAKVTLDVYTHLWPDEEDRTRAAIDGVLGASGPAAADSTRTSEGPETETGRSDVADL